MKLIKNQVLEQIWYQFPIQVYDYVQQRMRYDILYPIQEQVQDQVRDEVKWQLDYNEIS